MFFERVQQVAAIVVLAALSGCGSTTLGEQPEVADGVSTTHDANPAQNGFVLLELFTSEGCSSCPPADANLTRITEEAKKNGLNVYTLSFHVDYWNYIGWPDPFSSKDFTERQRQYAEYFKLNGIYTPQLVANGRVEFVGSNKKNTDLALKKFLNEKPMHQIRVQAKNRNGRIEVEWSSQQSDKDVDVLVALVKNEATRKVTAGENRGRTLTHTNVVRKLKRDRMNSTKGMISIPTPDDVSNGGYHLVVFSQSNNNGHIGFATRVDF